MRQIDKGGQCHVSSTPTETVTTKQQKPLCLTEGTAWQGELQGPRLGCFPHFPSELQQKNTRGMEELGKQDGRSRNVVFFFFFFYSVEKKKQGARGAGWTIWMKNLQKGTWKQKYSERKQNAKSTETVVLRTLLPEILPPSCQFCSLNLCLYHAGETEWHHFTVHGSTAHLLLRYTQKIEKLTRKWWWKDWCNKDKMSEWCQRNSREQSTESHAD